MNYIYIIHKLENFSIENSIQIMVVNFRSGKVSIHSCA